MAAAKYDVKTVKQTTKLGSAVEAVSRKREDCMADAYAALDKLRIEKYAYIHKEKCGNTPTMSCHYCDGPHANLVCVGCGVMNKKLNELVCRPCHYLQLITQKALD